MESIKTYLTVWLSGLIAGLILMERWRRIGAREIATDENEAGLVATPDAGVESALPGDAPTVTHVVFAGAKADALRVRHFVQRVTPWTPTPPPAQLPGRQLATTPASTSAAAPG
jgi:hypothetical protein